MEIMQHQIEIAAKVDDAFSLCRDVESWPQVFPPCKSAKVLEQDSNQQLIEISALANGRLMTWRSRRQLFDEAKVITFEQVAPSPLLARMEGAWRFFPLEGRTLVALEHRFAVKGEVRGLVAGVATQADALSFMTRSTDVNSRRELRAMKKVLEARDQEQVPPEACAEFEEELFIRAAPQQVYALLKNARDWPSVLPHCAGIDLRYDDGVDQEFVMVVKVAGEDETIRTVRHCTDHCRIRYFQPQPPPPLARHRGEWLVEGIDGRAVVVSRHEVVLDPEKVRRLWGDLSLEDATKRVVDAINNNSRGTMLAIQEKLAKGGAQ